MHCEVETSWHIRGEDIVPIFKVRLESGWKCVSAFNDSTFQQVTCTENYSPGIDLGIALYDGIRFIWSREVQ